MYAAINKKKKIVTTGQSKGQVRRKLCQMGLNFSYNIIEIEEKEKSMCPVCGSVLKVSNDTLTPTDQNKCFFCSGGIKLN